MVKRRSIVTVAFLAAFYAVVPTLAGAQAVAGSQLSGTVRDASGGVVPGATVTATKTDTGAMRSAQSGSDGTYILTNLPVGPYQLKVQLQGFNTYVRDGIVLQVNSSPTIDVTLAIGQVGEQVTVTANATMVEARATGVGQVIDNQRVMEMPLNGRQATELIFLSGVATSAPAQDLNTNKNYPTVTISVAGGQANGMTFIMDGGTHNDPFNNLNLPTPMPDALQEFKVETSSLPARYGHHAASAVNVVTKSGTNSLRGNVFEFLRNVRFNEKNYFAAAKDQLKRNQFGGTVGGPLVRDKVFIFAAYQGKLEKSSPPDTTSFTVTPAILAGDFTAVAGTASGCRTSALTLSAAQGFVDNKIDPARFSPVSLNFLKFVPVSNDPCGRIVYSIPNNSTEHQILGKIDASVSAQQSIMARYLYAVYDNPATYDGKNVLTLSRTSQNNQAHSLLFGHTWIVSTGTVATFHATYNKTLNDRSIPEYFTPAELGSKIFAPKAGFTGVSITGAFAIGQGATNPGYFNSDTFQIAEDVDMVMGKHQLAFGVNWIHNKIETLNNRPTNGQFTFNTGATGLGIADFMIGIASGGFLQGNPVFDFDNNDYVGAYVQDEWRPRSNVTVTAGLRWEPNLPIKNTLDYVSHFDQSRFDRGLKSTVYPKAPAGLIFPGDEGFPGSSTTEGNIWRFAPRTGAVWSPDERTAVKASWGMFYDAPHLFFNTRFANNPPWGAQITQPTVSFADPYATYPGGNPFPALATEWRTVDFPAFGVYVNTPLDVKPTTLHQWNIGLQRQIGEWLFSGSYLGNRSVNLWRATELNPAVFGAGATTGNTNTRRRLILQDPVQGQFYGTIGQLDDTGRANYHGMLLSANRRLQGNISMLANYTLSRCMSDPATTELTGPTVMNPANPDADYTYCASDRRHVANISAVIRTPRFENQTLNAIFGNWSLAPIVRYQTGNRATVTTGVDNALSGMPNQRAVQVPGVDPYGTGEPVVGANGIGVYRGYLNSAAFTTPAAGTYSNLKPFSIVNRRSFQNDLAVSRSFKLAQRNLQVRWEIFNVTNRVNFNAPITALNNSNFGAIQSAGDPRIMQFAVKMDF